MEIKMSRLILAVLFLFSVTAIFHHLHAAEYQIITQKNDKNVPYQAHDFYSIYYLYFNLIQALEIEKHVDTAAVRKIIFDTTNNLKQNRFSQLQISGYPGPEPLRVTLRTDQNPNLSHPILWLISNYSPQQKSVVKGDDLKTAYGTYFYMIGNKLVKYQRLKNPKSDQELSSLSPNSQADYYLLDEKSDNDKKGKQILLTALKKPANDAEQVIMNLTLSEYELLENNLQTAKVRLDSARDVLRKMSPAERKRLRIPFHYANDIYKLFSEYTGRTEK